MIETNRLTCMPFKAATPMNKKTPYRTHMGMYESIWVRNTLKPMRMDMTRVETRCSLNKWHFLNEQTHSVRLANKKREGLTEHP